MPLTIHQDIDYALLRTLYALLDARSVTMAARRLGVSQPAVSRALGRLRVLFDDPLLVRKVGGMVLTPRAEALQEPLGRWLAEGQALIKPQMTAPAALNRVFRIASTDYGILSVIAPAVAEISVSSPDVGIVVTPLTGDASRRLNDGEIDLIVTGFEPDITTVHARELFTETYMCMAKHDHPLLSQPSITPEAFFDWPHVVITVLDHEIYSLGEHGQGDRRQKILLWSPQVAVVPYLTLNTDAVAVLPTRAANQFVRHPELRTFPPPIEIATFPYWLVWHERTQRDPAVLWLIEQLTAPFRQSSAETAAPQTIFGSVGND